MFKDLINFYKNPKNDDKLKKNIYTLIFWGLFYVLFIFFYAIILKFTDQIISLPSHSAFKAIEDHSVIYIIAMGLFIAPVIEELTFRLILGLDKISFSLGIPLLVYFFINQISGHPKYNQFDSFSFYLLSVCLTIGIISYSYIDKTRILSYLNKKIKVIIYFTVFLFAFMHIENLQINSNYQYLVTPIVLLPQLLMGTILAFIRCKYGIVFSIILHSLFNLLPVLFFILAKKI